MPPYAYLRKSSLRDMERDQSHEYQEKAVRELASRHTDVAKLVILSDWDKSGRLGAKDRPGYAALWDAVRSGTATAIYSYSLSRLARSVKELSSLIDACDEARIPVRLVADHVDTSTASGRLLTNVLGAVAQFEADVAGERQRAAIANRRAKNLRIGPRLYGESQGEDVASVLGAFEEAGSYSGAARLLNERGITPRTSKRGWWPSAVAHVVGRATAVPVTRRGSKAIGPDHLLSGLLRCPTCQTLLTGLTDRTWRNGGPRVRYACRLGSVLPHPRMSVSEHLILPAIKAEVSRLRVPHERASLEASDSRQRAELEARRLRIVDMYDSGAITRDEWQTRLAAVREAVQRLDARRVSMQIPTLDWVWQPRNINAVLRALFESIELDRATFQPLPDGFKWAVPEWRGE